MALLRQIISYAGVGAINTVIGLAVILTLSELMGLHYILANAAGYAVGLSVSFVLNKRLTFRHAGPAQKRQIAAFLVVFAVSYACQFATLVFLVKIVGIANLYSQIIACAVYTVTGFTGNKFLTFRED